MELIIKDANDIDEYTRMIVELTYELEKSCQKKETIFCSRINLTPMEFRCVRYLYDHGIVMANELSNNLGVTRPRVTTILNKLEKKNLISRDIGKSDRRNIQISLNRHGKEFADKMYQEYMSFHKEILKVIGKDKMKGLLLNLSTFHQVLSKYITKNSTH